MEVLFRKGKIINFSIYLVICFVLFFSCKHEKSETPIKPELLFSGGIFSVSQEVEIQAGRKIEVRLKLSSQEKLKSLKIEQIINEDIIKTVDLEINKKEFEYIDSLETSPEEGLEEWNFTITDALGNEEKKNIKLQKKHFRPQIIYVCKDTILETDEEFILAVKAQSNSKSNENLNRFKIIKRFEDQKITQIDSVISTEIFSFAEKLKANSKEGKESWIISVNDDFNQKDSVVFNITTNEDQNKEYLGKIWNFQSDSVSAWDILEDKGLFNSDSYLGKDLQNSNEETFPPYHFSELIESTNGTLYRKFNDFDYENATPESILDGFSGGTISTSPPSPVTLVSKDDVFLLKLRNEERYAVIKILDVILTEEDNLDYIIFSYKK